MDGLQQKQEGPTKICCYNNSLISLSKNHVFHQKGKNIDIIYHFISQLVNKDEFHVEYRKSIDRLDGIFTKSFTKDIFEIH